MIFYPIRKKIRETNVQCNLLLHKCVDFSHGFVSIMGNISAYSTLCSRNISNALETRFKKLREINSLAYKQYFLKPTSQNAKLDCQFFYTLQQFLSKNS